MKPNAWLFWGVTSIIAIIAVQSGRAQTFGPDFQADYTFVDLGGITGLPNNYGGLTFKYSDPDYILIGGAANGAAGAVYQIGVTRDADNHVTGFVGTAERFADAAYNDGGVVYGPDNVLFLARWPVNELGQTRLGSSATDRIVPLAPFGVEGSISSLNFVPLDYRAAGRMKIATWSGGQWSEVQLAPDGNGTFDVTSVTIIPDSRLGGGPEGFIFVPLGSPAFVGEAMLVSEYSAGKVGAYEVDADGNPVVSTRRDFLDGLSGAEGAVIDPLTGDFLFSTFGGGSRVIVVRGFENPCAGYLRGDSNGNNLVNNFDIDAFVLAIVDPVAYSAQYGAAALRCRNDLNNDATVDNFDIDLFVDCLSNTPPAGEACP
ncbi:MAG: hypothetical protein JNG88_09630 [Phycisphaerales bacterium]|nr:hypothetical protein [Phycisphaerales bacterium]